MTDFLTDDEAAAYAEATQPDDATILPAPSDPIAVARTLVAALFTFGGLLSLRHWRGGWWLWLGSHWAEVEERRLRRDAYLYTENAAYINRAGAWQPWAPTSSKISGVLDATAAVAHLDAGVDQPAWIGDGGPPVVATANGLLDMGRRVLLPHTPEYFNQTAVPCGYDPAAPVPSGWLAFLSKLWPDDPDSIAVLQEWFGYVIGGRSDQHKILLLVGPTRGGKGVITRILGRLVGSRNVAGPTMASLGTPFGLAPLVGRVLAVISDARLDASRDASVIVERLLAISGEDTITVDIKYHEQWTGKLPTRFVVVSNELPRLGDASGTIANRFVALLLHESWLGREDHGLESALAEELPGILNWALEGLDRLAAQGRFTRPASTDEAIIAIQDLASPVAAFVREQCIVGPYEVAVQAIFAAWREWAEANGNRAGSAQTLARNLRAVIPALHLIRPREGEARERRYQGVGLLARDGATDRSADRYGPLGASARARDGASPDLEAGGPRWSAAQPIVGARRSSKSSVAEEVSLGLAPDSPGSPDGGAQDRAAAPRCSVCGATMVPTARPHRFLCTNAPGHPTRTARVEVAPPPDPRESA